MTAALLSGGILLLLVLLYLRAKVRALQRSLDRLEDRFIDHRLTAEEEIGRLQEATRRLRRLLLRSNGEIPFAADTPLSEAFEMDPRAGSVLASFGITAAGCACGVAEDERSIGEATQEKGVDLGTLLGRLNSLRGGAGGRISLPLIE